MSDFPTSTTRRRKARKPTATWLVLGGMFTFIWSLVFSIVLKGREVVGTAHIVTDLLLGIGLAVGVGVAGAVIAWLALHFIGGGRAEPAKAGIRFAVLAGMAVAIAIPISGFRVIGESFASEEAAAQEIRDKAQADVDTYLDGVQVKRDEIIEGGFFEAHDLAEPGGVARARRKLVALRALARQIDADSARIAAASKARLDELPVSGWRREAIRREFDRGYAEGRAASEAEIQMTMMMFDEMDAQLDVLSRAPGSWELQYGSLAFSRQRDLRDFNNHARRQQVITAEMQAFQRERRNRRQAPYARP